MSDDIPGDDVPDYVDGDEDREEYLIDPAHQDIEDIEDIEDVESIESIEDPG
jgi:hypothetical protein